MLPAFANATRNSQLVALISDDPAKLRKLSKKYGVHTPTCTSSMTDASRAAKWMQSTSRCQIIFTVISPCGLLQAGVHVLCEKPMAASVSECEQMIAAVRENGVKLMIADRLRF